MPKPLAIAAIDWKAVYESGKTYGDWLAAAESEERRNEIHRILSGQKLDAHFEALLSALPRPIHVIAIAEDWCGDVVRHVPVLERLSRAAPQLRVRYISREQHGDVFTRFLTNGGEAIPKFIFFSDQFVECGNWGPMPENCRRLIARGKACGNVGAAREKVSALYNADPERQQVLRELLDLIDIASTSTP